MSFLRIGKTALLVVLGVSCPVAFSACGSAEDGLFSAAASGTGATGSGSGTGASGSGTGATGSGTGTTGSGTGGGTAAEDCEDGVDNNGDGLIDCADAACLPDFECVDEAPSPWRGPVQVERAPSPSTEPACPGSLEHFLAGPAGAAQCSPCMCQWQGASCSAPEISCYYNSSDCTGSVGYMNAPVSAACIGDPPVPNGIFTEASCRLTKTGAVLNPGTCAPAGGQLAPSAPFAEDVFVCGAASTSGGCSAGQVCVPKTAGGSTCIVQPGAQTCPAGWTVSQIQVYGSGDDTRSCSGCQCDPAGVTCAGKFVVFNDDGCMGTDTAQVTSMTCVDLSGHLDGDTGSFLPQGIEPVPGACHGGQATGMVTPKDERTICCK